MWQKLRDFLVFFISIIQPIWAPDKQVKRVSLKICFRRDIQIFSSKNSTLRNFLTTQPLKKIILMYLKKIFFLYQGKERPAKQKIGPGKTPRRVSLRGVRLRTVLACAESTPRSQPTLHFRKFFEKLACFIYSIFIF